MAKESKPKVITYNENDRAIVSVLKENPDGLTLSEISEKLGRKINPGTITSVKNKGLIVNAGERDIERDGFKPAKTYFLVTKEATKKMVGEKEVISNYTDTEKAILDTLETFDHPVTLAEIATAMKAEKLTSGNINGLVKKGNVDKGEDVKVACKIPAVVNIYKFAKDVPVTASVDAAE